MNRNTFATCASAAGLQSLCAALCVLILTSTASAANPPELPPLTTVSSSPRLPGKFVWADLATDNVRLAQDFYGKLFRWSFRDYGGYIIAANDERPLCGMFQKPRPAGQTDARPRWIGFLSTANVKKAERAALANGGQVAMSARKFPRRGEQAILADPEGALFGVIKSSSGDPADFLAAPGDWIWMQLLSHDGEAAAGFYREVGGYEVIANDSENRVTDFVLASEGYARATIRTLDERHAKVKPVWLPFVRVASVEESVASARQLGGQVLIAPKPDLMNGAIAVVADPTGAAIGLMEWSEEQSKGGQNP